MTPRARIALAIGHYFIWRGEFAKAADIAAALVATSRRDDIPAVPRIWGIALQAHVAGFLADVAAAVGYGGEKGVDDLKFVAAARQAGIGGDVLDALRRERQFKAAVREWVAACVVRTFAITAMRIPMKPAASEQNAPITKPIAVG